MIRFLAALVLVLAGAVPAGAQDFGGAFGGFSATSEEPIQIEADRLEVHDAEKYAIYKGNVNVRQGETLLKTAALRVYYASEAGAAQGGASIDRIEAEGGVIVKTKDQTATGETAVFRMATQVVTLSGNVVLTQGENILKGDRLSVDLKTKQAKIEGGRVQTILTPSAMPQAQDPETAGGQ